MGLGSRSGIGAGGTGEGVLAAGAGGREEGKIGLRKPSLLLI